MSDQDSFDNTSLYKLLDLSVHTVISYLLAEISLVNGFNTLSIKLFVSQSTDIRPILPLFLTVS